MDPAEGEIIAQGEGELIREHCVDEGENIAKMRERTLPR